MSRPSNSHGPWLLLIFILSGFAGLIYQSIWTQYLGLFLGHSSHAQSLVLILFMGGMALGAWLVSRRSALLRRPLLAYAVIELLIGVLGIGFDGLFQGVTGWAYTHLMPGMEGASSTALRWALATALVLPQCILLGATFPLMSAGYMRLQPKAQGEVLAGLYFSNSLGAAVGALVATYLLLPAVGLPGTVLSAGLLNIVVAIVVYPLARDVSAPAVIAGPAITPGSDGSRRSTVLLVLLVAAGTGASSFVYEITWVRMLSLALGTTLHSFELMLAAFILGIAFGGLWLRRRADRMQSPLRVAGWVQVWMGLAALASMFVYAQAFDWVGWLMRVIVRSADGYVLYNLASAVIAGLVMFPAAFFAGMTLPLLTLALLRSGQGERSIGQAYAFNTLGAIVGVLAAIHLLMPLLGLKYALLLAAVTDVVLGLILLQRVQSVAASWLRSPVLQAGALGALAMVATIVLVRFDPLVLNSSVYRHGNARLADTATMLFSRDGQTATVAVYENTTADGSMRAIATNGKVDAGMAVSMQQAPTGDESTMILLAALPLALRDGYQRVGVIGFGSGLSTHTLLGDRRVGRVDTVEIEPAMVEGARLFGGRVERAFKDPRSHVVIDDAKSYFAASPRKYDLIISEPSNPWVGGTAALFSDEFYAFVPQQLNEGGVFVQWLQMYEITPELVSSVLAGMLEQFSDARAYLANRGDLILVATPKGKLPPMNDRLFRQSALREELARIGVHSLTDLQDTLSMDDAALRAFVPLYPAARNSDYFPTLKLKAPVARFQSAFTRDFQEVMVAPWAIVARPEEVHAGDSVKKPAQPDSNRDDPRPAARALAAFLQGTPSLAQDVRAADWLRAQALRGLASRCELDKAPLQSAQLVFALSGDTTPFLPVAQRAALWAQPAWLACPPQTPTVSASLALVAAVATDDHHTVLTEGRRLLRGEHGSALLADAGSGYYLFGAMQHAARSLGDTATSRQLTDQYWQALAPDARRNGPLRLLSYLASTGPVQAATADSQPSGQE
ncbi:TPA: fused MFS/spermidine synthase [Stenotrophomonas maltophilia]|nr:fused MFS/spermidine synthase [Stenotrophomonas maltophilia]